MDAWVWWLIVALVAATAEVTTGTLVFLMLAAGAVGAGIASLAGLDVPIQLLVFAIVSLLGVLGVRPIARRHLKTPALTRSGVAALVGADAIVLEQVDGRDGRIKLAGEVWSARSYDGQSTLPVGTDVFVIEIQGATALVAER